jgi:hypothetical protein
MTQILSCPSIRRKVLGDQLEAHDCARCPGRPRSRSTAARSPTSTPGAEDRAGDDDPSGRVAPYVVLFDGTGPTDLEPALGRDMW